MLALYVIIPFIALGGLYYLWCYGIPNRAFDTMPETSLKSSIFNGIAMFTMGTIYFLLNERFFDDLGGGDLGEYFVTFSDYVNHIYEALGGGRISYVRSSFEVEMMLTTMVLVSGIYVIGVVRAFKMRKYVKETNLLVGDTTHDGEPIEPLKYNWLFHAVLYPTTLVFLPAVLIGVVVPIVTGAIGLAILLVLLGGFGWLMKGSGIRIGVRHR